MSSYKTFESIQNEFAYSAERGTLTATAGDLTAAEKNLVNKTLDTMKSKGVDHFYISYLLREKEFNVRSAERILKLIKKGIFQPIL